MKTVNIIEEFQIPGRGKVFTADRRKHNFELLNLKGELIKINDKPWKVIGIEYMMGLIPKPIVGLIVKKAKENDMSDKEMELRKAQLYLSAYANYVDTNNQIEALQQHKREVHKVLCDAAGFFLGLSESETNRVLCFWDSVAKDARMILDIKE